MKQHTLVNYGNIVGDIWDLSKLIKRCPEEWSRLPQCFSFYGLLKEDKKDSYLVMIGADPYAPIYDVLMGVMAPSKEKAEEIMEKLQQMLEIETADSSEFSGRLNQMHNTFEVIANACSLKKQLQEYTLGDVGNLGG